MNEVLHKKELSITGIIVSIAVTAFFLWAAMQWYNHNSDQAQLSVGWIQANEVHAFENLLMISQAQKKYKETDWDGDGKKTYAKYFVHLWTSVNAKSEPIRIELIPKKLSFAMEAAKAIDGYYFIDLHDRISRQAPGQIPMDYEKEWAVLGLPVNNGQTGTLNFLADQTGSIFVNSAKYVAPQCPENPAAGGWTKIEGVEQLKDFQKKIIYPHDGPQK
jgi:Protein of unknown function (DUF2950)